MDGWNIPSMEEDIFYSRNMILMINKPLTTTTVDVLLLTKVELIFGNDHHQLISLVQVSLLQFTHISAIL